MATLQIASLFFKRRKETDSSSRTQIRAEIDFIAPERRRKRAALPAAIHSGKEARSLVFMGLQLLKINSMHYISSIKSQDKTMDHK